MTAGKGPGGWHGRAGRVFAAVQQRPWFTQKSYRIDLNGKEMRVSKCVAIVSMLAAVSLAAAQHKHDDIIVGRSAAGQLKIEFDFKQALPLEPASGIINGWALDEPGFLSLKEDEPGEDLFRLEPGADLHLEIVRLEPALKVHTPGFANVLTMPGDRWNIPGGHEFDEHPTWHIDSDDPGFNPNQELWAGSFKLIDTGTTAYGESAVFTARFEPVPEPTSIVLLAAGAAAAAIRRRRPS